MAYQDSDAERRNLLLTSLAFIVYFFAGGELIDDTIRLQVINVHFSKPWVLSLIAWFLLFWFFYRYWQKHSGAFLVEFRNEFVDIRYKPYIINFVRKKFGFKLVIDETEGYVFNGIEIKGKSVLARFMYATNIQRNEKGHPSSFTTGVSEGPFMFDGFVGRFLVARCVVETAFFHPSFSSYVFPYIVFFAALVGAFYHVILHDFHRFSFRVLSFFIDTNLRSY